ncbi:MAG: hypothetical protein COA97_02275 [Flavobacteriales bacterium]|nr:MAG: hypothetical protein COA97_02275 [Flavobacteriales bacterium]
MRKSIISALAILLMTTAAFAGKDKITLKEKVEQSKTVKVFFNVKSDIVDAEDERKLQLIDKSKHTSIKTAMPNEFASKEIKDQVIKTLNEGLQVGSAFVEGDISTLPESSKKATKYRDFSKLEDGLYAMVYITGEYTRFLQRKEVEGKTVFESSNRMEISSQIFFYEVIAGKVKKYGDMLMKSGVLLGHANTATKKTDKLESLSYMESNFPALPLLDEFKKTMFEYTTSFAKRKLKKHNKVVSKRK